MIGIPDQVGDRRAPAATRFQKGQSGNPKEGPRGRHREMPYDTVLGQMVTIREDGREQRITAAEAFWLLLTRKGFAGDSAAARASLAAIEGARARRVDTQVTVITRIIVISHSIGCSMRALGIAEKRFPLDKHKVHWPE